MNPKTECPKNMRDRAFILHSNGFGFQGPHEFTDLYHFIICYTCEELTDDQLVNVKKLSGSTTLENDECNGYYYLQIHWSEYAKIPDVFNALLKCDITFRTTNNLGVTFDPAIDKEYSRNIEELKAIERSLSALKENPKNIYNSLIINESYYCTWNWQTSAGKQFCEELRQKNNIQKPDDNNYFNWNVFKNYDPVTLQDLDCSLPIQKQELISQPKPNFVEDNLDEEFCMVCLEVEPDTMVLPCEHRVACKSCSIKLRETPNAKICIKCRQPIQYILE